MAKKRTKKEGSIWKDKNKWRAAIAIDGKRITRNFRTKSECSTWIKEMQTQIDRGLTYRKSNVTLGIFIKKWLGVHQTSLAPRTALRYEQLTRDYILPQLGHLKLTELRLDRIEAHYQLLLKQGLSPRNVRFVHSILHRGLKDGMRRGYLGYNPAHGATLPRYEPPEMAILAEDEVVRFLISIRGSRHEALYHLAIKTGLRQGELLGLKWSDLDWKQGIVRIHRQVQRIYKQGVVFKPPKTRSGRRAIQLGENMLQVLRSHLEQQQQMIATTGESWQHNNLVFPSQVGTPLEGTTVLKDFKKHLADANVKKIRFHDLRHTAASLLLNNGVPVLVVSKILGHSKTSTTLDIYGHLIPVMQEEAAKIMDEIVTPIPVELGEMLATKTPS